MVRFWFNFAHIIKFQNVCLQEGCRKNKNSIYLIKYVAASNVQLLLVVYIPHISIDLVVLIFNKYYLSEAIDFYK